MTEWVKKGEKDVVSLWMLQFIVYGWMVFWRHVGYESMR